MRIIAGPCQHESIGRSGEIADHCKQVCDKYEVEYYFKASFDKANRTSIDSERGLGLPATHHAFIDLKHEIPDLKILTDVHTVDQIRSLSYQGSGAAVDVLQIPAFLCRQTDLIVEACKTDKIINIKKGQFMAPWDVKGILSKTKKAKEVWITERGTCFGYGRLVNDFTGMFDLLNDLGHKFVYDITHSLQTPGSQGTSSGGDRKYVPHLARAGAALGISSFFIEVHADPDNAPSDGPNMLKLSDFDSVIENIMEFSYAQHRNNN